MMNFSFKYFFSLFSESTRTKSTERPFQSTIAERKNDALYFVFFLYGWYNLEAAAFQLKW